jgi:DNA-binding response OmpR family regulator
VRVLIVDDNKTFCEFLAETLERKGIEVMWTTDSLDGYKMSLSNRYDLFILDVHMPLVLGTELAAALKQERPGARIILISAFADAALRQTTSGLGVSLLSKPFSADHLLEVIKKTVAGQA